MNNFLNESSLIVYSSIIISYDRFINLFLPTFWKFLFNFSFSSTVVWNPWDKKAKAMTDFENAEYKHMLVSRAAAKDKPITLQPGEEWKGRQ